MQTIRVQKMPFATSGTVQVGPKTSRNHREPGGASSQRDTAEKPGAVQHAAGFTSARL